MLIKNISLIEHKVQKECKDQTSYPTAYPAYALADIQTGTAPDIERISSCRPNPEDLETYTYYLASANDGFAHNSLSLDSRL